jgi:LPXTG-site transpeptidase (sortase) family protein
MAKNSIKNWLIWIIPVALIAAGVLYLFAQNNHAAAVPVVMPAPVQVQSGTVYNNPEKIPAEIHIPNVDIKLNVRAGNFDQNTGKWTINNSDAYFAQGAATALIYGHNKTAVFGSLRKVSGNDRLFVKYHDGTESHFIYSGTKFVEPEDVGVLSEQNTQTIMLLTCDGLFNDKRRIVYFKEIQ